MAHSFVSRFEVRPDKQTEFIALCREMEQLVSDHEPDTLIYRFYRLDAPNMFAVIESFPDEAADLAHQQAPHARAIIERMVGCMGSAGYSREYLHDLEPR
jgi:autoinducer 2-degrading protein